MTCAFSRDTLALHLEGDLPDSDERAVSKHLLGCIECRQFLEQLGNRQLLMKGLRRDTIAQAAYVNMRRELMAQIENVPHALGWRVRIERMLFVGMRRHAAACVSLAIAGVISATLFAQMRQAPSPVTISNTVFAGRNTLVRPDGYRGWISIGSSSTGDASGPHRIANASAGSSRNVYIDRSAYREFAKTGMFPEGTVLLLETPSAADKTPIALEASVKDDRFDGGWAFFNFTNANGAITDKALAILDKNACRTCHEERARFDHVFTQFHPLLKTAT